MALNVNSYDISLAPYKTECTPNPVFRELSAQKPNLLENSGWYTPFTNASKSGRLSFAYAVVDATRQVQINHVLHKSVQKIATLARAILQATNFVNEDKLEMPVIKPIRNPLNFN